MIATLSKYPAMLCLSVSFAVLCCLRPQSYATLLINLHTTDADLKLDDADDTAVAYCPTLVCSSSMTVEVTRTYR